MSANTTPSAAIDEVMTALLDKRTTDPMATLAILMVKHNLKIRPLAHAIAQRPEATWKQCIEKISSITGYSYEDLSVPVKFLKHLKKQSSESDGCKTYAWKERLKKIESDIKGHQITTALIPRK